MMGRDDKRRWLGDGNCKEGRGGLWDFIFTCGYIRGSFFFVSFGGFYGMVYIYIITLFLSFAFFFGSVS